MIPPQVVSRPPLGPPPAAGCCGAAVPDGRGIRTGRYACEEERNAQHLLRASGAPDMFGKVEYPSAGAGEGGAACSRES